MRRGRGRGIVFIAIFAALLALPAPAVAVLSGFNGRIVFTSGRASANGDDSQSKLYLRTITSGVGAGTTGPTITTQAGQHRHPTWSPDRTMVAYARGTPGPATTEDFDIYILDLTTPGATPQPITNTGDNVTSDRPAWSPDGTRIAYENEVGNNTGQRDIIVQTLEGGGTLNLTNTASTIEGKPAWTPDSQTIYYHTGDPTVANSLDIVSEPAGGGTVAPIAASPAVSEFQASISPDGTQMCFTRGSGFNDSADVIYALSNGGGQQDLSDNAVTGDYNCTWSPDGTKIAYVQGTFTNGDLLMENSDDSSLGPIALEADSMNFDGNPDWAPDGRPECEDETITAVINTPVTIPLSCADTGPQYERTSLIIDVPSAEGTSNGTLGEIQQGDPARVTYTPNANFTGTDFFRVRPRDALAFSSDRGTITINVVRAARTISFDVNKNKVKKGKQVSFSGDVNAPGSVAACESNQPVELQRKKPTEASFTTFQQLQTGGAGNFSVTNKIKKTFEYRAVLGETQACEDASSSSEKVKAKKKKKK